MNTVEPSTTSLPPIRFQLLDPAARAPHRAHPHDAGVDLAAVEAVELAPGERKLVGTGIALAIPPGYAGFIHPRSGLALRHGLSVVNTPGTIDADYRGEIKVLLINHDLHNPVSIAVGDRIAQLIIQRVELVEFTAVDSLDSTERGTGGYGSTGVASAPA
ncbi:dUTP diphosphatase [Corynebacterium choanae]|uniref:dUTP diphosphatase n=1 Tax=Corynebacterium choanae TaxID=1862358 RepID=UPI001FEB7717|nr:dUTP diphosphatase [Corynebacterium choanae]